MQVTSWKKRNENFKMQNSQAPPACGHRHWLEKFLWLVRFRYQWVFPGFDFPANTSRAQSIPGQEGAFPTLGLQVIVIIVPAPL